MTVITEDILQSIRNLGDTFDPDKVPEQERQDQWFKTLEHLIKNLLQRENSNQSLFMRTLFDKKHCDWNLLKGMIEWAESNIKNWEQVFALSNRIKNDPSPDIVMYSALSEITAAKYLFLRGFQNLTFNKDGVDIDATLNGNHWKIEATYISGDDFKTQKAIYPPRGEGMSPFYQLDSTKLLNILKSKYNQESKQLKKTGARKENSLIVIVTYLMETYATWLSHEVVNGLHPILDFVQSREIPTVVIGAGSIYEPAASFISGPFLIDSMKF
jgi:hypothetical protein